MPHDAPLPLWPGQSPDEIASELDVECEWLITNGAPADVVTRNCRAEAGPAVDTGVRARRPQITHVFVTATITGVIDWSEAGQGDALYDRHPDARTRGAPGDVVAYYGTDLDLDDPRVVVVREARRRPAG